MINFYKHSDPSEYPKKGWGVISLEGADRSAHNDLIELTGRLTEECASILQRQGVSEIGNSLNSEVYLKGAVRSIIRYSAIGRAFAKVIANNFIEKNKNLGRLYLSPPYIIFHQPNDLIEVGPLHSDSLPLCGEMLTSWTPINKRQLGYAALTFYESTHSKIFSFSFKVINTLKSYTPFHGVIKDDFYFRIFGKHKINLTPVKDKSYYWDSHLLHKGNLNIENKAHLAMVFRISEKPLYYEPTCTLKEVIEGGAAPVDDPSLSDLLLELQKAEKLCAQRPDFQNFDSNYQNFIHEILTTKHLFNPNLIKHTAFSLVLIGHANPKSKQTIAYYLISYLLSKENIVGFKRVLDLLSTADRSKLIGFLVEIGHTYCYQDMTLFRVLKIPAKTVKFDPKVHNIISTW